MSTNQRFIDHSVVTDTKTGLVWAKTTIAKDATFEQAQKAVAALGEGWRLPTVEELFSLVDHTRHEPAIDTDVFPDTEEDCYWTCAPCAWNEAAVWVVGFGLGGVGGLRRLFLGCVRAVRSGQ
ncbi:DUF1566 domain-containing protein [Alcanivoracaceae bacterium MT1]